VRYVRALREATVSWKVHFGDDPAFRRLGDQHVPLPLGKVVIGLINTGGDGTKHIDFTPADCEKAWGQLVAEGLRFRGWMFWTIINGGGEVDYAGGLNEFMHTRSILG
jgi:hypothetical protein